MNIYLPNQFQHFDIQSHYEKRPNLFQDQAVF